MSDPEYERLHALADRVEEGGLSWGDKVEVMQILRDHANRFENACRCDLMGGITHNRQPGLCSP